MSKKFVIFSQSFYQTIFWLNIVKILEEKFNNELLIVCFDYESEILLQKKKVSYINLNSIELKKSLSNYKKLYKQFNDIKIKELLFHEINYYLKKNENKTYYKFFSYLNALNKCFKKNDLFNNIVFISELGAFPSNMAIFIYSKKYNIDNYQLEPSFFPERLHVLKNTFKCNSEKNDLADISKSEHIIKKILKDKKINIPLKDQHQFVHPIRKILNFYNFHRLLNKIYYQYILRKRSEFDSPINFSLMIFKNFVNSIRIRKYYSKLKILKKKKYIYFPLHVPNDLALTLRSREFFDQISLIETLAKKISKKNYLLVIKEHPARIGSFELKKLLAALKNNSNIKILNPFENTFNIIEESYGVVTVNSKTGFESILLKKPTVCLGDSFYKDFPNLISIEDLINQNLKLYADKDIKMFFSELYEKSFAGSLYNNNRKNLNNFAKTLSDLLK